MVFSSLEFIYLFLPVILLVFLLLQFMRHESLMIWWLFVASFAFYGWWSPIYLLMLVGSISFNFVMHRMLLKRSSRTLLAVGIIANLSLLAVFKYADFAIESFNLFTAGDVGALGLILPLAISFYTFQQISFLCDTYKGKLIKSDFKRYVLFVSFFPQLIAGPIVLQKDTIPQFRLENFVNKSGLNIAIGSALFGIGLFKKIVLADGIAPYANAAFQLADQGQTVSFETAWLGAIAYSFQIYFDFSGYCDMALGLARMFGIRLPINFNSPYKSRSIIEFWRTWHITLSRFLRDYLYIPLGGNRSGLMGAKGNLLITMLLGGLWHGAGWNFVIWGGLHGVFLLVNHGWRSSSIRAIATALTPDWIYQLLIWSLTMGSIIFAWVFFRAETFSGALKIVQAMIGIVSQPQAQNWMLVFVDAANLPIILLIMSAIVLVLPNSIQIVSNYRPVIDTTAELINPVYRRNWSSWRPTVAWGFVICTMWTVSVIQIYRLNGLTEFIYFNF